MENLTNTNRLPVLFCGHGNPMNAILDNEFTSGWKKMVQPPSPRAILCISAHWETDGMAVTSALHPVTIHDFYGFPEELYQVTYPAPGLPELADRITGLLKPYSVTSHPERGLDHGAWSVLKVMFPQADIPVIQLSLNRQFSYEEHFRIAEDLKVLRNENILIIGSGNIVHNLARIRWNDPQAYPWAVEFDEWIKQSLIDRNMTHILNPLQAGRSAEYSIPTSEHYLPLIYIAAMTEHNENITFYNESIDLGSIGMRSFCGGVSKAAL